MSPAARAARAALTAQGAYYAATGLWPLASMRTFELVTGPKTDDWLVHMVGLLAAVIGATLLLAARARRWTPEVIALSVGSAAAFTAIDVVYVLNGTIAPIYLADALAEVPLALAVLVAARRARAAGDAP